MINNDQVGSYHIPQFEMFCNDGFWDVDPDVLLCWKLVIVQRSQLKIAHYPCLFFGLLVLQKITRRLLPEWIWLLWREAHEQVVFLLVLTHVLLKQREGCSGETVMSLLTTLRSSTAWPTLILLMAASRLSWSTRSSCCCRPDIWSKNSNIIISVQAF